MNKYKAYRQKSKMLPCSVNFNISKYNEVVRPMKANSFHPTALTDKRFVRN